ncbi:hypothetical protein VTO42DRAFT_5550 [Malbranchea cinnamomea]
MSRSPNSFSSLAATPSPDSPESSTPSSSFSSDKENHSSHQTYSQSGGKRRQPTMEVSRSKRRRVSRDTLDIAPSQVAHRRQLLEVNDTEFYDPDQDPEERRAVRKGLKDLATLLNDSRMEYLRPESTGIRDAVERANELFKSVKQTSDATIDSRLLVNAADLSYKRTAHAVLGGGSTGIDVDEFISKCISFMRGGVEDGSSPSQIIFGTQRRRRISHRSQGAGDDSDNEDDVLNWDWLGRRACFPYNSRPSLPGFLLGPLSIQKRTRQVTQRRARQERIDPSQAVRPQQLKASDLEKQETSNLTAICTEILDLLKKTRAERERRAEEELNQMEDVTEDIAMEVMEKHGIADDAGIPLFRFCINPQSFGQTVENLFYVSFLIKEGSVGVSMDSNDLPTLHPSSESVRPSEAQRKGLQRRQAVFTLDFETWEDLIEAYNITESIIPHRDDEEELQQASRATGWYS